MNYALDEKDIEILTQLQPDSTLSNLELAKRVGMAPSAVLERVKSLSKKASLKDTPHASIPMRFN